MRHILLVCLLMAGVLFEPSPVNADFAHDWSHCYGGPNVNFAYDVAVDGSGGVVIVGAFAGTMNLGGGTLTSAGAQDVFLARFDANGVHQWSQRFGGAGMDVGNAVTVDGAGNITITGQFRGPVSFGGTPLAGHTIQDIFVANFSGTGLHRWSHWYGGSGNDQGQDIVADASGNVIVTGQYGGAVFFGGVAATPAFGSLDLFLLKLDASGRYQWSKGVGGLNPDVGWGLAVDASNNILLTGVFSLTVDFGGGPRTSAGSTDVFAAKYDTDGGHQWSWRLGGPTADLGQAIGVDATGCVVVTGMYNGTFLVKCDAAGAQQWSQTFASSDMVQSLGLAVSPGGTIVITGNLRGTTNFGGGPLSSAGDDDIFLAVCDATGAHRWSQRYGNTGDDWGYGCGFDPSGNLIAAGIFSNSVDFGGGPLPSAGVSDVYVVKFDDYVPDTTPPAISCPADVQVDQTGPGGTPATHPTIAAFLAGASASDDVDPAPVITTNAPAVFPLGTTPVVFRATDAASNQSECTATVTVLDTTPPRITVVMDKTVLWPPNHKFVTVCAQVTVSDNGSTDPTFTLVSVTSNEPPNWLGDGDTGPDIQGAEIGTPDLCFDLRAERSGNGNGRVYEIVYAVSDGSSDPVYATAYVRVPHDNQTALTSVHPNPFNPQTTLVYALSADDRVEIAIYDVRGALVRRLVNQIMPAGEHRVSWNGVDEDGRPAGSGVYFVKLATGSDVDTRKIIMLK